MFFTIWDLGYRISSPYCRLVQLPNLSSILSGSILLLAPFETV